MLQFVKVGVVTLGYNAPAILIDCTCNCFLEIAGKRDKTSEEVLSSVGGNLQFKIGR